MTFSSTSIYLDDLLSFEHMAHRIYRRRVGLVVERRTPEPEVGGSILTQIAVLCH